MDENYLHKEDMSFALFEPHFLNYGVVGMSGRNEDLHFRLLGQVM